MNNFPKFFLGAIFAHRKRGLVWLAERQMIGGAEVLRFGDEAHQTTSMGVVATRSKIPTSPVEIAGHVARAQANDPGGFSVSKTVN